MLIRTPASQYLLQFFASPQHICFHGAERNVENAGGLVVRKAVLAAQNDRGPFVSGQQLEGAGKIMAESGIDGLRVMFRLQLSFVDANQFLSFSGFLPETVVGDPVKPGRESRLPSKAAEIFISPQKGLLREIVRERKIGADKLAEQTPNARLVVAHQLGEGVVVILEKNAGDEVCIG
jgi:hypothetical protein